jgi:hypothetical protein
MKNHEWLVVDFAERRDDVRMKRRKVVLKTHVQYAELRLVDILHKLEQMSIGCKL